MVASPSFLRALFFYPMAKRLTDTKKWNDDWYVSLSNDYKIIWQWLLDNCDHAGICKPSIGMLNMLCKTNISESDLLKNMDGRVIKGAGFWFIPKFLKFQYKTLNVGKPAIVSVVKALKDNNLLKMINELYGNDFLIIMESLPNHSIMIKDTDTDKDKDIRKGGVGENLWNATPLPSDVGLLPEAKIKAAIERIKYTLEIDVGADKVAGLYEVFKKENLTGKKYYPNEEEVQQHFSNWLKFQKFEKNGKSKIRPRDEGIIEFLEIAKRDYEHYQNEQARLDSALPSSIPPNTGAE